VIILDDAEAIDFEFLRLNPLDPPEKRLEDQSTEDPFCQRLLLLGAKWWDSEARYSVVEHLKAGIARADGAFIVEREPPPTMREKRFVKVGWPSTGGFWVAEFDTTFAGVNEEDNLLPDDEGAARLRMARTMDERCLILQARFQAIFYEDVKDYKGYTFLNCWETKDTGEAGQLLQPDERYVYGERLSRRFKVSSAFPPSLYAYDPAALDCRVTQEAQSLTSWFNSLPLSPLIVEIKRGLMYILVYTS
jgi:hypothetical protein